MPHAVGHSMLSLGTNTSYGGETRPGLDATGYLWDNPTMSTAIVDAHKRIVLPEGRPGDVFDIQPQAAGRFLLVCLETPEGGARLSREACLEAMRQAPLRPTMPWEALRALTREP